MNRFLYDILLFVAAVTFPWWIVIPLMLVGVFVFRNYIEVVVVGIIMDRIFIGGMVLGLGSFLYTYVGVAIYVVGVFFQDRLMLHR